MNGNVTGAGPEDDDDVKKNPLPFSPINIDF